MSDQKETYTAQKPVSGEPKHHTTQTGAKLDQAFQDVKEKIPGTQEYKATHPTGTTMASGTTATGPAYGESTSTTAGMGVSTKAGAALHGAPMNRPRRRCRGRKSTQTHTSTGAGATTGGITRPL